MAASSIPASRPPDVYRIDFSQRHPTARFNEARLRRAIEIVLADSNYAEATISVAIVDDDEIQVVNRRFLEHDYATDVISFVLDADETSLDGEVVVSADTAARIAARLEWSVDDELLLYVVHGTLHLIGYDDLDPDSLREMRAQERVVLQRLGITARYEE